MGTPRPNDLARSIIESAGTEVIGGSVFENEKHLPKSSLNSWQKRYEGTALYRQEMLGELLDEMPGALWTYKMINDNRISLRKDDPRPEDTVGAPIIAAAGYDCDWRGSARQTQIRRQWEQIRRIGGLHRDGNCRRRAVRDADTTMFWRIVQHNYAQPREWAARIVAAFQEHRVARLIAAMFMRRIISAATWCGRFWNMFASGNAAGNGAVVWRARRPAQNRSALNMSAAKSIMSGSFPIWSNR